MQYGEATARPDAGEDVVAEESASRVHAVGSEGLLRSREGPAVQEQDRADHALDTGRPAALEPHDRRREVDLAAVRQPRQIPQHGAQPGRARGADAHDEERTIRPLPQLGGGVEQAVGELLRRGDAELRELSAGTDHLLRLAQADATPEGLRSLEIPGQQPTGLQAPGDAHARRRQPEGGEAPAERPRQAPDATGPRRRRAHSRSLARRTAHETSTPSALASAASGSGTAPFSPAAQG